MQERGEATYLVAWKNNMPCGRVTLLHRSKYALVREIMGDFPEMNALEAIPQGVGIGSRIIASAEQRATALGAHRIGLAVEHDNTGARRLYERLGYVDWNHGEVIDRWHGCRPHSRPYNRPGACAPTGSTRSQDRLARVPPAGGVRRAPRQVMHQGLVIYGSRQGESRQRRSRVGPTRMVGYHRCSGGCASTGVITPASAH